MGIVGRGHEGVAREGKGKRKRQSGREGKKWEGGLDLAAIVAVLTAIAMLTAETR